MNENINSFSKLLFNMGDLGELGETERQEDRTFALYNPLPLLSEYADDIKQESNSCDQGSNDSMVVGAEASSHFNADNGNLSNVQGGPPFGQYNAPTFGPNQYNPYVKVEGPQEVEAPQYQQQQQWQSPNYQYQEWNGNNQFNNYHGNINQNAGQNYFQVQQIEIQLPPQDMGSGREFFGNYGNSQPQGQNYGPQGMYQNQPGGSNMPQYGFGYGYNNPSNKMGIYHNVNRGDFGQNSGGGPCNFRILGGSSSSGISLQQKKRLYGQHTVAQPRRYQHQPSYYEKKRLQGMDRGLIKVTPLVSDALAALKLQQELKPKVLKVFKNPLLIPISPPPVQMRFDAPKSTPISLEKKVGEKRKFSPTFIEFLPTTDSAPEPLPVVYRNPIFGFKKLRHRCTKCGWREATLNSLRTHVQFHRQPYCMICCWIGDTAQQLAAHKARNHAQPDTPERGTMLTSKYGRKRHVSSLVAYTSRKKTPPKSAKKSAGKEVVPKRGYFETSERSGGKRGGDVGVGAGPSGLLRSAERVKKIATRRCIITAKIAGDKKGENEDAVKGPLPPRSLFQSAKRVRKGGSVDAVEGPPPRSLYQKADRAKKSENEDAVEGPLPPRSLSQTTDHVKKDENEDAVEGALPPRSLSQTTDGVKKGGSEDAVEGPSPRSLSQATDHGKKGENEGAVEGPPRRCYPSATKKGRDVAAKRASIVAAVEMPARGYNLRHSIL